MNHQATTEGTARYAARFSELPDHFRLIQKWHVSSIGLGTYLGEGDEKTDRAYEGAIQTALQRGCNLIDTAINYRFQRSERNIGRALKTLFDEGTLLREEIVISTKGGFLSFDGEYPPNPARYFHEEYVQSGICQEQELVAGCHCLAPSYLENQVDRSLRNLGLECLDIYFLHNPETQLSEVTRQEFLKRIRAAFKLLERKVAEGKIRIYGTATWNGYRVGEGTKGYLSLEDLIGLAREVGGEDHHFRAIQLPYNLAMPEAYLMKNQKFGPKTMSAIEAASNYGLLVMSSASILQGQLAENLPSEIKKFFAEMRSDAQRSIQFVRSTPGVTSALIGMSNVEHVEENLETTRHPTVPWTRLKELFA